MATKTTATKTATAKAAEQINVAPEAEFSVYEYMRSMAVTLGVELPTGRMLLVSTIASLGAGVLTGYSAIQLASYLVVGAAVLTGSAFIAYLIAIIATIGAVYMSLVAVSKTFVYMASGQLEHDLSRAKTYVNGFFARGKKLVRA